MNGIPWRQLALQVGDRVSVQIASDWWGFALGYITHVTRDGRPFFRPDLLRWGARLLTNERVILLGRNDESMVHK
jgi:hypothetical protein